MDIMFEKTPAMFGPLHLAILALIAAVAFLSVRTLKVQPAERLIRLLHIMGMIMIIMEVWKQWFVYSYIYTDGPSAWFFPWQLCSMAMYLCAVLPFLNGKAQNTALAFLASYSLLADIIALVIPSDMLRPQILLFAHGFIYHGLIIIESLIAVLILRQRRSVSFIAVIALFLEMAAVAEVINVISHHIINNIHWEANMFYITHYYPTTQPVFDQIAAELGIWPEVIIYLSCITLGSALLYRILVPSYRSEKEL